MFVTGSALCGLAGSIEHLIAVRAFQGLGAGGLFTLAMAIIGELVATGARSLPGVHSGDVRAGQRGRRLAEALSIIRPLLVGQSVDFAGTYYRVSKAAISPVAVQSPPPILIAANQRRLLDLATRERPRPPPPQGPRARAMTACRSAQPGAAQPGPRPAGPSSGSGGATRTMGERGATSGMPGQHGPGRQELVRRLVTGCLGHLLYDAVGLAERHHP